MQNAHKVSMKELVLREREASHGGSTSRDSSENQRVRIPKDLVPGYVVGDDIDNWLQEYEVAMEMHRVLKGDWRGQLVET